jgi:hypothetical protein
MVLIQLVNQIKNDFSELASRWLVLFGSYVNDYEHARSDIDLALISGIRKFSTNKQLYWSVLHLNRVPYDLKLFELLPLNIQIAIIQNYKVIFGNELDISEYFYKYKKIWMDNRIRIEIYA